MMYIKTRAFSPVEQAIEAIAKGRVVIVVDSEDREDEGDFTAAAEMATPEIVHFMAKHGRGQLCMPVLPDTAERLDLKPMVSRQALDEPRFAIPVDHRGCRSGISPVERAMTIQAVVSGTSRADDFVRPGHIFPLIAQNEGVLRRPGHTEAAVDLARLAGLKPAGLLCEICSRDGRNMARGDELRRLAARFRIPILAIDDLIEYQAQLATDAGLECSLLQKATSL